MLTFFCSLGGNPWCNEIENASPKNGVIMANGVIMVNGVIMDGDLSNRTFHAEMNCRYNSSSPFNFHDESYLKKLPILPSIIYLVHKFIMDSKTS
jgi:hypothetical protein